MRLINHLKAVVPLTGVITVHRLGQWGYFMGPYVTLDTFLGLHCCHGHHLFNLCETIISYVSLYIIHDAHKLEKSNYFMGTFATWENFMGLGCCGQFSQLATGLETSFLEYSCAYISIEWTSVKTVIIPTKSNQSSQTWTEELFYGTLCDIGRFCGTSLLSPQSQVSSFNWSGHNILLIVNLTSVKSHKSVQCHIRSHKITPLSKDNNYMITIFTAVRRGYSFHIYVMRILLCDWSTIWKL